MDKQQNDIERLNWRRRQAEMHALAHAFGLEREKQTFLLCVYFI